MSLLRNKVVLITGVSRGLGLELVSAFAAEGCQVVGIARSETGLRAAAEAVGDGSFVGLVADVADFDQVRSAVEDALEKAGRIDIVFNNAAVYPRVNFVDETPADWATAMAVNVNGIANVCKAVLPSMLRNDYGRIYNIGSFADIAPIPESAAYSAAKGAVRALTKAIAADLRDRDADIEVHEWIPGHLKTRMSDFTGIEPAVAAGWAVQLARQPHARTPNGIYENDREWLPPKGLRQRVTDKIRSLFSRGS